MTCQELIDAIHNFDLETVSDDELLALEQVLKDAVTGIEEGLPLDPAKRPSMEERLAEMGERLKDFIDAPPKEK